MAQTAPQITRHFQFDMVYPSTVPDQFRNFVAKVQNLRGFNNQRSFNDYCRGVVQAWRSTMHPNSFPAPRLQQTLAMIGPHNPLDHPTGCGGSIPVPAWGGVLIDERRRLPSVPTASFPERGEYRGELVKKWLAVRDGGYLALERHRYKEETLRVEQGAGVILFEDRNSGRPHAGGLRAELLLPASAEFGVHTIDLNPSTSSEFGPWHGVIGFGLLLYEVSTDHLGMDNDLHFQFTPE